MRKFPLLSLAATIALGCVPKPELRQDQDINKDSNFAEKYQRTPEYLEKSLKTMQAALEWLRKPQDQECYLDSRNLCIQDVCVGFSLAYGQVSDSFEKQRNSPEAQKMYKEAQKMIDEVNKMKKIRGKKESLCEIRVDKYIP